jgi:hypothetical protein
MINRISILNPTVSIVQSLPALKRKFSLKTLRILTLFLMLSLIAFSIVQFNAYIKETYLLQGYEKKLNQLREENKILEINFSRANSLNNIGNYVQNFEKVEKVEYIRVLGSTVVAKPKQ